MAHNCFSQGCELEVQYVCRCLTSVTYFCEFHIESHLKSPNIAHSFDSILTEPSELTKEIILKFLEKEKSKKEKLKKIALTISSQKWNNTENSIKSSLNDLNSDLEEISCLIAKISKIIDKNPLNSLISQHDTIISETILPNDTDEYSEFRLFCKLGQLRNKKSEILNRINNNPEIEQNFKRTCLLYENFASNSLLSQAYQEYISGYQKITSGYILSHKGYLYIYNTEAEKEANFRITKAYNLYSRLAQLPNGEFFFISKSMSFRSAFILDRNYQIRKLPRGTPENCFCAIYFNRSVYCLGGIDSISQSLSRKFDLDENRWTELALMKKYIGGCFSSVIFNRNILISIDNYHKILMYSIDIDSFSEIPYIFAVKEQKILVNAGEILYLIECKGWIYESEVGDEYHWKKIAKSIVEIVPWKAYCSYNKGGIYISVFDDEFRNYFKFDLNRKNLIEIAFYSKNLSIQRSGDNFETIEYHDNYFRLNRAEPYINKEDKLYTRGKEIIQLNKTIKQAARALVTKGNILCGFGSYLEAIECYNQALNINLNYVDAFISKGFALQKLERHLEAIECFNELIEYKSKYELDYCKKENSLNNLGRASESKKNYKKIRKLEPDIANAYNNKGESLYNLDRNIEAIECYNEAIKIMDREPIFYLNRVNALNKLGRHIEASQDLNEAYKLMEEQQAKE